MDLFSVSAEGEPESGVQNRRDSRDFAHTRKPKVVQFLSPNCRAEFAMTGTALDTELINVWNCLFRQAVEEMLRTGGPDWQRVLGYVESIYRHFEM